MQELGRGIAMKARMKDNLILRYQKLKEFDYRPRADLCDFMNELQAIKNIHGMNEYFETKKFLKSIEGKIVDLVFTRGDAFEKNDNNVWLPDELWDAA